MVTEGDRFRLLFGLRHLKFETPMSRSTLSVDLSVCPLSVVSPVDVKYIHTYTSLLGAISFTILYFISDLLCR